MVRLNLPYHESKQTPPSSFHNSFLSGLALPTAPAFIPLPFDWVICG